MNRYKLTLTIEYFFKDNDYIFNVEQSLENIIKEKSKKIQKQIKTGKDEYVQITKAHLDKLPF